MHFARRLPSRPAILLIVILSIALHPEKSWASGIYLDSQGAGLFLGATGGFAVGGVSGIAACGNPFVKVLCFYAGGAAGATIFGATGYGIGTLDLYASEKGVERNSIVAISVIGFLAGGLSGVLACNTAIDGILCISTSALAGTVISGLLGTFVAVSTSSNLNTTATHPMPIATVVTLPLS